jgi:tetratricopeptide (TPR) repeat protein
MMQLIRIIVGVSMLVGTASAEQPAQPPPWAAGVTPAQKATAQQHLDRGNELFLERKFFEALAEYELARDAWNHPAIHFNIVRCMIHLERFVDASDHLQEALKYGAEPYDETIYAEALAYQTLIAKQIGNVEITCAQDGVELTLDGEPLLSCPGREVRRVKPGQHQVVGTKPGYLPRTMKLVVFGGDFHDAVIELDPLEKAARIEHRWKSWVPWSVVGAGLGVAGIGGLVRVKATSDNRLYKDLVDSTCTAGCPSETWKRDLRRTAELENYLAIGLISVGAATVVAGGVMLYLNRGRTVYETSMMIGAMPVAAGGGLSVRGTF